MPLFHAQYTVKAEFLFAPLDEKAVGVEHQRNAENSNNARAQKKDGHGDGGAGHLHQPLVHGDGLHDIVRHDAYDTGEHIGKVGAFVFAKVRQRQFGVKRVSHGPPLPSSAW